MQLDATARTDLFRHLQDLGYTGADADLWALMKRLSFQAQLRAYRAVQGAAIRHDSPAAGDFLERVLDLALKHFDTARPEDLAFGYGIALDRSSDRRRTGRQRPVRLGGLYLDIDRHDLRQGLTIRCRLYVNNEFRRDRYYTFPLATGRRTG